MTRGRTAGTLTPALSSNRERGPDALSSARVGRIRRALLAWEREHASGFPWRDARNPYWALVAGVCSQQTQMSRVLPLWERFTSAFPTIEALAAAEPAEVLRVWQGAGYPRRALSLHATAQLCMAEYDGALPRPFEALLALPGVGPFTAAIVATFGFGDDAAAVDTNVVRVIGRLVYGDVQPALETPAAAITAAAARLLPPGEGGAWNAALMDYGARVCMPRPRCGECVVARACAARVRFEAGAVATPVRAQGRFAGSDRQWRGRIMRALSAAHDAGRTVRTSKVVAELASGADEVSTVRRLLRALCEEGLAWESRGSCGLGQQRSAALRGLPPTRLGGGAGE